MPDKFLRQRADGSIYFGDLDAPVVPPVEPPPVVVIPPTVTRGTLDPALANTDVTIALQKLIDTCDEIAITAPFISGTLNLPSKRTIYGVDAGALTLRAGQPVRGHLFQSAADAKGEPGGAPTTDIVIRNLTLNGNALGQRGLVFGQGGCIMGIALAGSSGCRISGVVFRDWPGDGLYLGSQNVPGRPSNNNIIEDCLFEDCLRNGLMYSDASGNILRRSAFRRNQAGMNPAHPMFMGTDSSKSPWPSAHIDIERNLDGQVCRENLFEDLMLEDGWWTGFQISRGGPGEERNVLRRVTFSGNARTQMIIMTDGATATLLDDCSFLSPGPATSKSSGHLRITQANGVVVKGCHFKGACSGAGDTRALKIDPAGSRFVPTGTVITACDFNFQGAVGDAQSIRNEGAGTIWGPGNVLLGASFSDAGTGTVVR